MAKPKVRQLPLNGTTALIGKVQLTKWTASQPVTKRLALAADGAVQKTSTAATLYDGEISRLNCSPREFLKLLKEIGPNDCLSYGIPVSHTAKSITTTSNFKASGEPADMMPRTAEAMVWPSGPGIMMIDYDPTGVAMKPQELLEKLYECCPEMQDCAHVWAASSSSCLYDTKTKKEIRGIEGQRVYVIVADARDIPRAAAVLSKRSWLKKLGYIKISKSGSLLERCILDTAVFQTNRIDFCAPAICEHPLAQKKPLPALHGSATLALNTKVSLPELQPAEVVQYQQLVDAAKANCQSSSQGIREQFKKEKIANLVAAGTSELIAAKLVSDSFDHSVLGPSFVLYAEDGREVTVGELLADRKQWNGSRFADPIEPDYHNDQRIARANLLGPGRPTIHSFAHGSHVYHLTAMTETIRLVAGERNNYMNRMVKILVERGELYRRADRLVAINHELQFEIQSEHHMLTLFDRSFRFESFSKSAKTFVVSDPPATLAQQFLGSFQSQFPVIKALVTAPIIDPRTRRLINTTGYDATSAIYVAIPDNAHPVIVNPTIAEIGHALKLVWQYVRLFPYAEPIDDTVMLTAMLTAVLRPMLPTAPGFAFDAPVQSSGKSLLTKVLAELCGSTPVMSPYAGNYYEEETRKSIFAMLLQGRAVIIIDNVTGEVDSPSLAAVFTSEEYSDRILGKSKSSTVPTNSLILMSGNNLALKGDLPRRVLKCRIDPKSENPHQRTFDFDPAEMVRENRQEIVSAALTLVFGYFAANVKTPPGKGRVGSFEVWDGAVRQTVCWLADLLRREQLTPDPEMEPRTFPRLVDPFSAIAGAIDEDPALLQLGRLLAGWENAIGTGNSKATRLTVKQLEAKATFQGFPSTSVGSSDAPVLSEVLKEVAGERTFNAGLHTRKLGIYLSANADRIVGGRCLRKGQLYQNSVTWWVDRVDDSCESGESVLAESPSHKVISISNKQLGLTKVTKTTPPQAPAVPAASRDLTQATRLPKR